MVSAASPDETIRPLVLASQSPRRKKLLQEAGLSFEAVAPQIEETFDSSLPVEEVAETLAHQKALQVARLYPGRVVLGADTLVAIGERILGKPEDASAAREMLGALSGSKHRVVTGICIFWSGGKSVKTHETSWVTMRPLSQQEIEAYVASGEWEGKAGAYAIQETADRFVTCLKGAWDNVVGLPIERVRKLLAEGPGTR